MACKAYDSGSEAQGLRLGAQGFDSWYGVSAQGLGFRGVGARNAENKASNTTSHEPSIRNCKTSARNPRPKNFNSTSP